MNIMNDKPNNQRFYTKRDIEKALNVSRATIANWLKTGVLPDEYDSKVFEREEFDALIRHLLSLPRLKGRANRSLVEANTVSYLGIKDQERRALLKKAVDRYHSLGIDMEEALFSLAEVCLRSAGLVAADWPSRPRSRIELFLLEWAAEKNIDIAQARSYFADFTVPPLNDDFLGAFYQSVQTVSAKSKRGSYYTPSLLLEDIRIPPQQKVLDPCCGSGGILLNVLSKQHPAEQIHAWDIDETALKICRVNLCLFFGDPDINPHIAQRDAVFGMDAVLEKETFDCIITNPPWGSKFSRQEKELLFKKYPELCTSESFSIVLYNSLQLLSPEGRLIFFLPHSFLNVAAHSPIRKYLTGQYLAERNKSLSVRLLGNSFPGVMSEAIRLEVHSGSDSPGVMRILRSRRSPVVFSPQETLRIPASIIPATASADNLRLINKVYEKAHVTLKDQAKFALGIVTGNNHRHLLSAPTPRSEPIYRGQDIGHFRFYDPVWQIEFQPEIYQQVAPLQLYRRPKIVYRFIADKLVCALDPDGKLLLNSANLFIPTLDYPLETIVALFNSALYTFLYRKMFHAKKVLRTHLESFPLPLLSPEEHQGLKRIHDRMKLGHSNYDELNEFVDALFGLTEKEKFQVGAATEKIYNKNDR